MKRTTVLSIILLIAFFMPWVDYRFISISGFDLPNSIVQLGSFFSLINDSDTDFLIITYVIYLIPIFSILTIASQYVSIPFSKYTKKLDYYLALIFSIIILLLLTKMNNRFFSFIGVGFYLTLITSIIGIVVKDKALIETKNTSQKEGQDSITKLSQLKELLEKELISMEEYQQKKEEILRKIE
jgi:hypothetical protein